MIPLHALRLSKLGGHSLTYLFAHRQTVITPGLAVYFTSFFTLRGDWHLRFMINLKVVK